MGSGCQPTTAPIGDRVYHVCAESVEHPDIFWMSLTNLKARGSYTSEVAFKDAQWGHEYCPRVSTDNRWLTYGASTGCQDQGLCDYEVFAHKLEAQTNGQADRTRITNSSSNDHCPHMYVGPLWSKDLIPKLHVRPSSVQLQLRRGAPLPLTGEVFEIRNQGGGMLKPVVAQVARAGPNGWLDALKLGIGNQQTVVVKPNANALLLPVGRYRATVVLSSKNLSDKPLALEVGLEVSSSNDGAVDGGPHKPMSDGGCAIGAAREHGGPPFLSLLQLLLVVGLRVRAARQPAW